MEEKGIQMKGQHKEAEANNTKIKFLDREKVECTLNPNIPRYDNSANDLKRCEIVLIPDKQVESYRYMYQTRVLESMILTL